MKGHLEVCILKLDDEVDEYFILHLRNCKFFSAFPELFCHPVGNDSHIFQIVNISLHICNFLRKESCEPQLSPSSPLFILKYETQRDDFSNGQVKCFINLYLFLFC